MFSSDNPTRFLTLTVFFSEFAFHVSLLSSHFHFYFFENSLISSVPSVKNDSSSSRFQPGIRCTASLIFGFVPRKKPFLHPLYICKIVSDKKYPSNLEWIYNTFRFSLCILIAVEIVKLRLTKSIFPI